MVSVKLRHVKVLDSGRARGGVKLFVQLAEAGTSETSCVLVLVRILAIVLLSTSASGVVVARGR